MDTARKTTPPDFTEDDLRSLMTDGAKLLLHPDVEPLARALRAALSASAESEADAVIAATMLAGAAGACQARSGQHAEALAVQIGILEQVYQAQHGFNQRTLH